MCTWNTPTNPERTPKKRRKIAPRNLGVSANCKMCFCSTKTVNRTPGRGLYLRRGTLPRRTPQHVGRIVAIVGPCFPRGGHNPTGTGNTSNKERTKKKRAVFALFAVWVLGAFCEMGERITIRPQYLRPPPLFFMRILPLVYRIERRTGPILWRAAGSPGRKSGPMRPEQYRNRGKCGVFGGPNVRARNRPILQFLQPSTCARVIRPQLPRFPIWKPSGPPQLLSNI